MQTTDKTFGDWLKDPTDPKVEAEKQALLKKEQEERRRADEEQKKKKKKEDEDLMLTIASCISCVF